HACGRKRHHAGTGLGVYGGRPGEWGWHLDDHWPSHDCQRPGTHFRVRQHPGERQHHPGLRPQLPGPGGFPAQCGVGPDAEYAPPIDLCKYLGACAAWRADFFDLDGVQSAQRWPAGCDGCAAVKEADVAQSDALLTVRALRKYFPVRGGLLQTVQTQVKAVDGVSFEVQRGEILGIVGESGCGKSTLARLIQRLIEPDAAEVRFAGQNSLATSAAAFKAFCRQVQMVFQDPYSSLNPRMNIEDAVAFNARVHGDSRTTARTKAWEALHKVGLRPEQFGRRYPHELSGGQRQRVNIARALVLSPTLVILDEPVSSLDKSVQAQVLNLLQTLKHDLGLTYLFISHDLLVIEYLSDRVLVMYLGQIMEMGSTDAVSTAP